MTKQTHHNLRRCQQRGIPTDAVEILLALGIEVNIDNEACHIVIPKRRQKHIVKALKRLIHVFQKSPYSVLSHDDVVITTAYKLN